MKVINPINEAENQIKEFDVTLIPQKVSELRKSEWRNKSVQDRVSALQKIIDKIKLQKENLAKTISNEMGKPLNLALVEVERSIDEAEYFLKNACEWLDKKPAPGGYVLYEPLGVIAVISPWNFPVMLPLRSIMPALITGNSVIFKPSELSLQTGIELSKYLDIPELENSFFCVVGGKDHGKAVVESDVKLIAFTGSTAVGKSIFKSASDKLKHVVLELGGLDSAIVLSDVNIAETAKSILRGNTANSGQVCNAVKRVYVEESIYPEFLSEIIELSSKVSVGNPSENPDMGPLVSLPQLERVQSFVDDAKEKGGNIHTGGKRAQKQGYYYPSTIISNIQNNMKIVNEEAFGPILPVMPVKNWQEAVELTNASLFGLNSSIWTKNIPLAEEIARKLEVGGVSFNTPLAGGPGTPWGGCKESGIGRQKTREGLLEFCNTKYIKLG